MDEQESSNNENSSDGLSDREVVILAACCGVVSLMAIVGLTIWLWFRRKHKVRKRVERVNSRLDQLSLHDPLEEILRRESKRVVATTSSVGLTTSFSGTLGQGQRALFKIWDHTRTNRQVAVVSTIAELMDKARDKLSLSKGPLRIVLEQDGTEIGTDIELWACWGNVCMILEEGQSWKPAPPLNHMNPATPLGLSPTPIFLVEQASNGHHSRRDSGLGLPVYAFYDNMAVEMMEVDREGTEIMNTEESWIRL